MDTTSTFARTFADKFEEALEDLREKEPGSGLRTIARKIAKDDPKRAETVRRQLHKYRPRPGGGAAAIAPTEPTRREIEKALGLEQDALKADPSPAEAFISVLMPRTAFAQIVRAELRRVDLEQAVA